MHPKNIINHLKSMGLNSYEAKLWVALLSKGVATAGELSDISNVPRSRSYDVLESLEKKGFVMMKLGKPIKYIAVRPIEALDRTKKRILLSAETKAKLLEEFENSELLNELNLVYKNSMENIDASELSSVFRGRESLYSHLDTLFRNAEKSILIMTTSAGLQRKSEAFKNGFRKAKEKGVKIKILAPVANSVYNDAKNLSEFADVRSTAANARFCIVDGKTATFMILDDSSTHPNFDTGVHIKTPFFAASLGGFFNSEWNAAEKLGKPASPKPGREMVIKAKIQ